MRVLTEFPGTLGDTHHSFYLVSSVHVGSIEMPSGRVPSLFSLDQMLWFWIFKSFGCQTTKPQAGPGAWRQLTHVSLKNWWNGESVYLLFGDLKGHLEWYLYILMKLSNINENRRCPTNPLHLIHPITSPIVRLSLFSPLVVLDALVRESFDR